MVMRCHIGETTFQYTHQDIQVVCVVVLVATMVLNNSLIYCLYEEFATLFQMLIISFAGCMLVVLLSDSLILCMCMWEVLGGISFILIRFWGVRSSGHGASISGLLLNKSLDPLLAAWVLLQMECTASPSTCSAVQAILQDYSVLCQCIVIFAVGVKSVAMGIHLWLPDAMEGPTQVSALIHAASLVIAGFVLVSKFTPVLTWLPFCILSLASTGAFAYSLIAVCIYDLKRIVAFSTGWHVALLAILMTVGIYFLTAHIITHAIYKATLFVCLGSCIHQLCKQDVRSLSATIVCARISVSIWCCSSSMGFCFTAVFYTKKVLVDSIWSAWVWVIGCWLAWLLFISLGWSVSYTITITCCISNGTSDRYLSCSDGHGIYSTTASVLVSCIGTERSGVTAGRALHRSTPRIGLLFSGWYVISTSLILLCSSALHWACSRSVALISWSRSWDTAGCRGWLVHRYIFTLASCSLGQYWLRSGWPPPPCVVSPLTAVSL
jgi:NADH:ubiquinone oxidoreductase subunit 5 (subunit L)/multisubunit Na+/H+ antiporter MnhA subunit